MSVQGWKYYNHAMIPDCAPNEEPNLSVFENGEIWKKSSGGGTPLFARWTSDYDNPKYEDWWYIIQDKPIEIENLKKSHRRKINKGLANFKCHVIDPNLFLERMADITLKAWQEYPDKYRPLGSKEQIMEMYRNSHDTFFGCFNNEGILCGFDVVADCGSYWRLVSGKVDPEYEKGYELNAAMTYTEIQFLKNDILKGKYISNGQRNTVHETNFNEDLCHYYGFRKVNCRLNIIYNPRCRWIINIVYPFRSLISLFEGNRLFYLMSCVLKMEEIARKQSKVI